METVAKRLYEAMFLVDSAQAAADWEGTLSVINNILQRADAEIVAIRKWQERKLAYDIGRATRGTYILCFFKVDGRRINGIEKDVQLSEKVIRVLVLTTEKRPAEMLERDISGEPPVEETAAAEASDKPAETAPSSSEEAPKKPEEAPAEKTEEVEPTSAEPVAEAVSGDSEGDAEEKKDESAE